MIIIRLKKTKHALLRMVHGPDGGIRTMDVYVIYCTYGEAQKTEYVTDTADGERYAITPTGIADIWDVTGKWEDTENGPEII